MKFEEIVSLQDQLRKLIKDSYMPTPIRIQANIIGNIDDIIEKFDLLVKGNHDEYKMWIAKFNDNPNSIRPFIRYVYENEVDDKDNSNSKIEFNPNTQNKIRLSDSSTPNFLYRVVSQEEMDNINETGKITPSEFYKVIHASIVPELKYGKNGDYLLKIRYSDSDGWRPKSALDQTIYAVTNNLISKSRIAEITKIHKY